MKKLILYSTHCPRCRILQEQLETKGLKYEEVTDIETMRQLNILSVPLLEVDGDLMDFNRAFTWINNNEEGNL